MPRKTLKSRIDDLVDKLGLSPKPSYVDIRNELMEFGSLAQSLESGESAFELGLENEGLKANITRLETELENAHTERDGFKAALDAANGAIDQIRAEQQAKGDSNTEKQFKILEVLKGGRQKSVSEIAQEAGISGDKCELLLGDLYDNDCVGMSSPTDWHLLQKGLRRLDERGKL
jgi:hypothetical protein